MLPCQAIIDRDPLLYIDITEAIHRNIGKILYADTNACLIGFPHGSRPITEFTILCGNLDAAKQVFPLLPWDHDILFAVHEEHCLPYLRENYHIRPFLGDAFYQVAYLASEPLSIPESPFTVAPLDISHLKQVISMHPGEEENYFRDRLESGTMLGAFDGDVLVGFIGVHGEGSIGLLQVHSKFRRRGIGKLIETHMINHLLALGHTPYGSVLTDNVASLSLQRSLGMTASVPTFHWFCNE